MSELDILRSDLRKAAAAYATAKAEQVAEARRMPSQAGVPRQRLVAFIDAERKRQKMTTMELNARAGYSRAQLGNMRTRKQRLTIDAVEDFLNALGYQLAVAPIENTLSGHPLGSPADTEYHRANGQQMPKEQP